MVVMGVLEDEEEEEEEEEREALGAKEEAGASLCVESFFDGTVLGMNEVNEVVAETGAAEEVGRSGVTAGREEKEVCEELEEEEEEEGDVEADMDWDCF